MTRSIDFHGYSVPDAMERFVQFYNKCLREGYRGRIEIIHGYGSNGNGGEIGIRLRQYLSDHEAQLDHFLEGDKIGNPGITVVYPRARLKWPGSTQNK